MAKFNFEDFAYGYLKSFNSRLRNKAERQAEIDKLRKQKLEAFDLWKKKNEIEYRQTIEGMERDAELEREQAELEEKAKRDRQAQLLGLSPVDESSITMVGDTKVDTSSSSALKERLSNLRQRQSQAEAIGERDIADALKIRADELEKEIELQASQYGPVEGALGEDVSKAINDIVDQRTTTGTSPFFVRATDKDTTPAGTEDHMQSLVNTQRYAAVLAEETKVVNPVTGAMETRSELTAPEIGNIAFTIERNLNTLEEEPAEDITIDTQVKAAEDVMSSMQEALSKYPPELRKTKTQRLLKSIPKNKRIKLKNFTAYKKYKSKIKPDILERANKNNLPLITDKQSFDKLPAGARFIDFQGNIREK